MLQKVRTKLMKKIILVICILFIGFAPMYSAATLTVEATVVNADGTLPVHGTVTLKKTKSKSGQGGTVMSSKENTNKISISANGRDQALGGLISAFDHLHHEYNL